MPRAPLATARCSPGGWGPLRPRRRGTHSDPGRPPPPPLSVMTPPHTHTLKHAHAPRRPGGGGSVGVSVGCALTRTCVWKTGALPAGVRAEIASSRCDSGSQAECGFSLPPPPTRPRPRLFQVHQGIRGKGRARSPQAGAAGHAGLLRRRRKWWGPRAGNPGRAPPRAAAVSAPRVAPGRPGVLWGWRGDSSHPNQGAARTLPPPRLEVGRVLGRESPALLLAALRTGWPPKSLERPER